MKFIYYPKCSTCKKAKNYLDKLNIKYEEQNIKENPPTYKELHEYYLKSKLPLKKFINTSGLIYKSMNLKEKINNMKEEEILKLLSENGMLIKRPILVSNQYVLVGYKEEEYKKSIV